jgi:HAD superfamily phosphatase (TIGR01681 family)
MAQPERQTATDSSPLLAVAENGSVVRVLAIGDSLLDELRSFLSAACRRDGVMFDMRHLRFGAVVNGSLDATETLEVVRQHSADLIALSFLTYEGIPAYPALLREGETLSTSEIEARVEAIVGLMRGFLSTLRNYTDAPFLVHGVCGLPLSRWRRRLPLVASLSPTQRRIRELLNREIRTLVEHTPNTLFIDEAAIAASVGLRACEHSVVPQGVIPQSRSRASRFGELLSESYARVVRAYAQLRKTKVLLVDFDDTLWHGPMADGPVEHHRDRQRLLLRLKEAGVLLVALSKNDPAIVRWDEMQLKPKDFALLKISWGSKADAIRAAAAELDLDLDSMVFIDDNPVERALIREHLPAVCALDANDDRTWDALVQMLTFPNTKETNEVRPS